MANTYLLTPNQAANVLRTEVTDAVMGDLLPMVTSYICEATGRAWNEDTPIHPVAQAAARMLLVLWYENPGMGSAAPGMLPQGLTALLSQLEAKALQLAEEEAA